MPSKTLFQFPLGLAFFLVSRARASLPYNPVSLLQSTTTDGLIVYYILEPPSSSQSPGQLRVLDTKSTLDRNALSFGWSATAPPLQNLKPTQAYTAFSQPDGSIALYVGDCSETSSQSHLWRFVPDGNASDGSGSWIQEPFQAGSSSGSNLSTGASWLAAGMSFSYNTSLPGDIYVFGGMCPELDASPASWQSEAAYSNQLLSFDWRSDSHYSLSSEIGQPTPEAGFTITPLLPAYSNQSDGSQTQQQDFVLIGGHTQSAFIGMDQVALYSLPQNTWTFQSVAELGSTDLTVKRQTPSMEPRSGHTSTLTADGSKIIVLGGWVGDVSTPAQPQLAVLDIGAGFEGSGDWTWAPLADLPSGAGDGIYGHGAIMLPGDILLITGGYTISSMSGGKSRRALPSASSQNLFFNTTSGQWIVSYNGQSVSASTIADHQPGGALHTTAQKVGLGVGLAVGLVALILLVVLIFLYYRRLKGQREDHAADLWADREKEIQDLTDATQHRATDDLNGYGGSTNTGSVWTSQERSQRSAYPWVDSDEYDTSVRNAARSGVFVDVPSPQRGLRRSMYSRGQSQSAPRFDEDRLAYGSGAMSAIQEEETSNASVSRKASSTYQKADMGVGTEAAALDPFADPEPSDPIPASATIRRIPVGFRSSNLPQYQSSSAEERQREMSVWMRDWQAASHHPQTPSATAGRYSPVKSGRSSPSKSERTRSDLSDRSVRSNEAPLPTRGPSTSSVIRSYLPSILPTALTSPFFPSSTSSPTRDDNIFESSSSGASNNSASDRTSSFTTARTTITQLQAESEALLGNADKRNPANKPQISPRGNAFNPSSLTYSHNPRSTGTADLIPDVEPTFTLPRARTTPNPALYPSNRSRHSSLVGTWVGSVRRNVGRALAGGRTVSLTSDVGLYGRPGGIGSDGYYEYSEASSHAYRKSDLGGLVDLSLPGLPHEPGEWTTSTTTTTISSRKGKAAGASKDLVRRSVSDTGTSFWKPKRGARDWDVDPIPPSVNINNRSLVPQPLSLPRTRDDGLRSRSRPGSAGNPFANGASPRHSVGAASSPGTRSRANTGGSVDASTSSAATPVHGDDPESDWDVEAAVEQRVVQVMFTVPRERLRVVNADVDAASVGSGGAEGADAGGGSEPAADAEAAEPSAGTGTGAGAGDAGVVFGKAGMEARMRARQRREAQGDWLDQRRRDKGKGHAA